MMDTRWYGGIDVGAAFIKVVIIGGERMVGSVVPSAGNYAAGITAALDKTLKQLGIKIEDVARFNTTGLGAARVPFTAGRATEASCLGAGMHRLNPAVRTIIDVGEQSTRIVKIDEGGRVAGFNANEKCAAGSGRFLQVIAKVLHVPFEQIGELSLAAKNPSRFSTNCAVFAESEVITRLAQGTSREDILAGVHIALANKIASMLSLARLEPECAMVGGGARDVGLIAAVQQTSGIKLYIPPEPQTVGALGAALLAERSG